MEGKEGVIAFKMMVTFEQRLEGNGGESHVFYLGEEWCRLQK